jgi:hypothetical protein
MHDDDLDHLLARGKLSGAIRDRIVEGVLRKQASPPWWRRWALVWWLPPVTAAVVLFAVVPRNGGFSARGSGSAGATSPLLEVSCRDGEPARCPQGSALVFRISGAEHGGYLAVYAEPIGAAGERVWYFPESDGSSPEVEAQVEPQILSRAVRLGGAQPPGTYEVHLVLGSQPLDREEALFGHGLHVIAANRVQLEVTR